MSYEKYSGLSAKMTINSIEEFIRMIESYEHKNEGMYESLVESIKESIKVHKDTVIELEMKEACNVE